MTPEAAAPSTQGSFFTPQRIRLFGYAAGAVVIIAVVIWFFITAGARKEAFASDLLNQARSVAESGDLGQAASQFDNIIKEYRGTQAGYEASIGLAQVRLIADQDANAISGLSEFLKQNPPAVYASPAQGLLGTAYENTGKYDDALAAYRKAADLAAVPYLKVGALLNAARAANLAGKKDDAVKILEDIIKKYPDINGRTEAELMLGELTGGQG